MSDVEEKEQTTQEPEPEAAPEAEDSGGSSEPSPRVKEIIEQVTQMTVLELAELVKALEETFGVSAAAPMAMMAAPEAAGAPEAAEKTAFDVVLASVGGKKIQVIKVVRAATNLGLKEAKGLVDKGPGAVIKSGIPREEAETLKGQLEEAGATVELK